jgi:hypothetical protein
MNSKKDLLQGKLREVTPTEMHAFGKTAVWDRGYPIKTGFRFFWRMIKANELAKTTEESDLYKKLLESEEEIFGTIRNNTRRSKVDVVLRPNNNVKAVRDQNVKGEICVRVWRLDENQCQELVNAIALWNLLGTLGAKHNTGCGSCVIDELDISQWGTLLDPWQLIKEIKLGESISAQSSLLGAPIVLADDVLIKSGFKDQNAALSEVDKLRKKIRNRLKEKLGNYLLSGRNGTRKPSLVRFKIHQIPAENKSSVLLYVLPIGIRSLNKANVNEVNYDEANAELNGIVRGEASSFKALDSRVTWENLGVTWGRG